MFLIERKNAAGEVQWLVKGPAFAYPWTSDPNDPKIKRYKKHGNAVSQAAFFRRPYRKDHWTYEVVEIEDK